MSLYRRGGVWWYKFKFSGQVIRESTRTDSKNIARDAERSRRRELELGYNGVSKAERAHTFSVAAESYIRAKTPHLAERSIVICAHPSLLW
jgi:hypothetical protein